jgi:hypothetical protein
VVLDTAQPEPAIGKAPLEANASLALCAHSLVVLSRFAGAPG